MYCGFLPARHLVVWAPAFSFLYTPSLSLRFLPFRFGSEQPLAASCSHLGPPALSSQLKPLASMALKDMKNSPPNGAGEFQDFSHGRQSALEDFMNFPVKCFYLGSKQVAPSGCSRLLKWLQVAANGLFFSN